MEGRGDSFTSGHVEFERVVRHPAFQKITAINFSFSVTTSMFCLTAVISVAVFSAGRYGFQALTSSSSPSQGFGVVEDIVGVLRGGAA